MENISFDMESVWFKVENIQLKVKNLYRFDKIIYIFTRIFLYSPDQQWRTKKGCEKRDSKERFRRVERNRLLGMICIFI